VPPSKHQPPFPYYGSKAMLAPWIISKMPEHTAYVEPFFGSGAVLLGKPMAKYEAVNDVDGEIVNFFRVLRDRPDELVSVLQLTPHARDEYAYCIDLTDDPLEQARRTCARYVMAFNGQRNGGYSFSTKGKQSKATGFKSRIDSRLSVIAERLRNVDIENWDALKFIDRWDHPDTLAYIDPPYLASTRSEGNDRNYANDNGSSEFHTELVERIRQFRGTVVLSGYPSKLYDSLGWRRYVKDVAVGTSNVEGAIRIECLWVNRS
jgi:DNA adenine methylase